ncbi:hypothetical protein I4U23_013001 [Adineta vaga]|nr:hypothetical protein I4U23_013001 [Adineta vaga]
MSSSHNDHAHDHQHHHAHQRRALFRTKTFRLLVMLTMTFSFFIVELIVGNLTKSVALVADAFHMLSDVISLVIGIVAVRIVKRRSNANTFGWVRAEVVGANINTVFLLALCLTIIFDAIKRFIEPEPIENVNLLLIVGSIGLGINIIGLFLFQGFHGHSHGGHSHGHGHGHAKSNEENGDNNRFERHSSRALQEVIADSVIQAEREDQPNQVAIETKEKGTHEKEASMNMHGVFLHVLADALGSVVVIISALIIKFVPHNENDRKHWTIYIDPTLSVVIIIIITISTIPLFRDTSSILLQTIPKHLEIHRIKTQLLETIPEISSIHELHIWRLTDEKIIASAHLHRKSLTNYMLVADKVKKFFHSIGIHSVTMQYECDDDYQQTPVLHRSDDIESKIAGDCLLRCEDSACDSQACCTIVSVRSNTLLNDKDNLEGDSNTIQVSSISRPYQHTNPIETLIPMDELSVHEKF